MVPCPLFLARDGRRQDRHGAGRIVRRVAHAAWTFAAPDAPPGHDLILPGRYGHLIRDLATQIKRRPSLQSPARQLRQITAICAKTEAAIVLLVDTEPALGTLPFWNASRAV